MNVRDRTDNPYRPGTSAHKVWERAKRERFDITEDQIEFTLYCGADLPFFLRIA